MNVSKNTFRKKDPGKLNVFHKTSLLFTLFLLAVTTGGQAQKSLKHILEIERMQYLDSLENAKAYNKIIEECKNEVYDCGFSFYSSLGFLTFAYFETGNYEKGFEHLILSIKRKGLNAVDNMKYNYNKYKLDTFTAYKFICKNFDSLYTFCDEILDKDVINQYDEIFFIDQGSRNKLTINCDSSVAKEVESFIWQLDSINALRLQRLIRNLGRVPGISDMGPQRASWMIFVFKHLENYLNMEEIFAYLEKAFDKNEITNSFIPFLTDMIENMYDRKSKYGFIYDGNTMKDIADIEYVDSRRKHYFLKPLWREAELDKNIILPKDYNRNTQKTDIQ